MGGGMGSNGSSKSSSNSSSSNELLRHANTYLGCVLSLSALKRRCAGESISYSMTDPTKSTQHQLPPTPWQQISFHLSLPTSITNKSPDAAAAMLTTTEFEIDINFQWTMTCI